MLGRHRSQNKLDDDFKKRKMNTEKITPMSLLEERPFLFKPLLMFKTLLCFDLIRTYCFFLMCLDNPIGPCGSAPEIPRPFTRMLDKKKKKKRKESKPNQFTQAMLLMFNTHALTPI